MTMYITNGNSLYAYATETYAVMLNHTYHEANTFSEARSATDIINAEGLHVVMPGNMPASTTNRLSVPYTLVLRSTTAVPPLRPSSSPILQLPIQWFAVRAEVVMGYYARAELV